MNDEDLLVELYSGIVDDEDLSKLTLHDILIEGNLILNEESKEFTLSDSEKVKMGEILSIRNPIVREVKRAIHAVTVVGKDAKEDFIDNTTGLLRKAKDDALKGGIGSVTGGGLAQMIAWLLRRSVAKTVRLHQKELDVAGSEIEFKYSVKQQEFLKRVAEGGDVSAEELEEAKTNLIDGLHEEYKDVGGTKVFLAKIVDKVADIIGSRYGTAAFALAGTVLGMIYIPQIIY